MKRLIQFMKNPLHREDIKPGTHRLGGVGVERKVRIRDIVSSQALVDEKKVRKLARFTRNMPGKATVSWNGKNWIAKDGNHRLNAMLKQGKRKATVLVQKLSSQQPVIQLGFLGSPMTTARASALKSAIGAFKSSGGRFESGSKRLLGTRIRKSDGARYVPASNAIKIGDGLSMPRSHAAWHEIGHSADRETLRRSHYEAERKFLPKDKSGFIAAKEADILRAEMSANRYAV